MNTKDIIKIFKDTASLMELHAENEFKVRTYNNAAFNLEKVQGDISGKGQDELQKIEGIGNSIARDIKEIVESGTLAFLEDFKSKTPEGVLDMLKIKGTGPKKIRTIWKDLGIESLEQLLTACEQDKISSLKGFGSKTQENIKKEAAYILANKFKMLYADAEPIVESISTSLEQLLKDCRISICGDMRRKMEIIEEIKFLIGTDDISKTYDALDGLNDVEFSLSESGPFCKRGKLKENGNQISFVLTTKDSFHNKLLLHTGSEMHLARTVKENKNLFFILNEKKYKGEKEAYEELGYPYVLPELREGLIESKFKGEKSFPELLNPEDLKGSIHNHSTYSDGKNTLREMAEKCIDLGYEYLGISDHSKSAFYAQGLQEYEVKKQHEEINKLNEDLAPFKIFKGIESDILNDGALDYDDDVLASFDFIVASIHSNLNMDIEKATNRLLKAINNKYTTFLGHSTGRLLLRREGYPIDHKTIIDACAENKVIIEINANPWRLDLDWRWVPYALEKGVLLSINPDAHETEGFYDMKYGVYAGRKGGLTKENTFNCFSLQEVERYFTDRKQKVSSK